MNTLLSAEEIQQSKIESALELIALSVNAYTGTLAGEMRSYLYSIGWTDEMILAELPKYVQHSCECNECRRPTVPEHWPPVA